MKQILIFSFLFRVAFSFGQTYTTGANQLFTASYNGTDMHRGTYSWNHLQLGNNGPNYIIAGRSVANGSLHFIVNNINDIQHPNVPTGILAMILASNGNVGIGTPSPSAKLDVIGTTKLTGSSGDNWFPYSDGNNYHRAVNHIFADNSAIEKVRITNEGNVGIGTQAPQSRLDIRNPNALTTHINISNGGYGSIANPSIAGIKFYALNTAYNLASIEALSRAENIVGGALVFNVASNITTGIFEEKMRIESNGNVGIGTSDTKGYKLAIAGNAVAEKMVVKLKGNWPDFVFKPEYKLPPLSIIEQHIKEKGHLQDIPSEKEVAEKGIDLGSMDAKLLQKIEELTLYLIDQQKQIDELKKQNELLMQLVKQK
jgi:hypothetical protein